MLSNWPIRYKLMAGLALLVVILATLTGSGGYGLYSYRSLVKGLKGRSGEIPSAIKLIQYAGDMRSALSRASDLNLLSFFPDDQATGDLSRLELREQFRSSLAGYRQTLNRFRREREQNAWRVDSRCVPRRLTVRSPAIRPIVSTAGKSAASRAE